MSHSIPAEPLVERIWARARQAVGTVVRTELGPVHELDLARFDTAVCGSVEGDIGGLATPLYLSSVLAWSAGPAEKELLPDGNAPDPFSGIDLAGLRLMGGGQELVLHGELRAGVPVSLEVTIADVELKSSRTGSLLVLTVERRYSDPDGLLVECTERFLGREEAA